MALSDIYKNQSAGLIGTGGNNNPDLSSAGTPGFMSQIGLGGNTTNTGNYGVLGGVTLSDIQNIASGKPQQQLDFSGANNSYNNSLIGSGGPAYNPAQGQYWNSQMPFQNGGIGSTTNGIPTPLTHTQVADAIRQINNAHTSYNSGGGSSGGALSPYGQAQQLTQNQWSSQNGLSPYSQMQAGNAFTPQEYQQLADTQAAGFGNQLTNLTRGLAWNTASGGGFGGASTASGQVADFNGYNVAPYASNPSYAKDLNGIYSTASQSGAFATPQALTSYIQSIAPGSSLTGDQIFAAAQKYGVDPGVLASMAQDESQFGTKGLAVKTNNPTNFGNEDGGQTRTYGDPSGALEDTAHWLSRNTTQGANQQNQANFQQYGLLATVPTFNPNSLQGAAEANYLQYYLSNQKEPTASSIGLKGPQAYLFTSVASNAQNLFEQATGYALPSVKNLQGYQATFDNNVKVLNNLETSSSALQANAGMMIGTLKSNDFNGSNQIVNGLTDFYKNALGDGSMAQYLAQNQTVTQELGNLFAVRNASGTTVADKMSSGGIFNSKQTLAQQQAIANILSKEAGNVKNAFVSANEKVFRITDPFLQNPDNPLRDQYINQNFGNNQQSQPQTMYVGNTVYTLGSDGNYTSS